MRRLMGLRCAGDEWLEGASSSSDDDEADEDYGARRRATGARAGARSGGRQPSGGRPAAAAQRPRVKPGCHAREELKMIACLRILCPAKGRVAARSAWHVALAGAPGCQTH